MIMVMVMVMVVVVVMRGRIRIHRPGNGLIFMCEKAWRDLKIEPFGERVQDIFLHQLAQGRLMLAVQLLRDGIFKALKIFKTKPRGQFIVNRRITFFTEFVELNLKDRIFAGQVGRLIFGGEGDLHINRLAGLGADEPILKAWDKAVRTQFKRMSFGRATVKRLTVNAADEIYHRNITKFGRAGFLHRDRRPVFISDTLKRFFNFFWIAIQFRTVDGNLAQVRNGNCRHDFACKRRFEVLPVFIGFDVHLRLACKAEVVALDRLAGRIVKRCLDCVATHLIAKTRSDNRHRHLAWPEPRHFYRCCNLFKLFRYFGINFGCSD